MAARRIIMFNRLSADGYFAGPDGNLDWVVQDDEVDKAGAANIPGYRYDAIRAKDLSNVRELLAQRAEGRRRERGTKTPRDRTALGVHEGHGGLDQRRDKARIFEKC
jgi:hypothetical protein